MYDREVSRGQIFHPAAEGAKVVGHTGSKSITYVGEGFCTPSGFVPSVRILAKRMEGLNDEGSVFNEQRVDRFEQRLDGSA